MSDVTAELQTAIKLHQSGCLSEAGELYADIVKKKPGHSDAHHLLGVVEFQRAAFDKALDLIDTAISLCPQAAIYHSNRGRVLKAVGKNTAAASAFARALYLQPGVPESLSDLAGALIDSGEPDTAILFAKRAIERGPDLASGHYNYGLAATSLNEFSSARKAFERAVDLAPGFAPALFELGCSHQAENNDDMAERYYRRAIATDPLLIEAHANLGNILRSRSVLEEAIAHYDAALNEDPEHAVVHGNRGVALQEMGDTVGALSAYDRALALDPENAETQRNRAQLLLQMGRLPEGWAGFEWRWKTKHFASILRNWHCPQWNGRPQRDATVLVHAEQGFGDTIQFARYLPMMAAKVGRVVLECPAPLSKLMARCEGVDDVIVSGSPLPVFDFHIPMMSLPGIFATDLNTIPDDIPYLSIASELRDAWSERIGGKGRFRIGVVWKGSDQHQRNTWRSPGLAALQPLLKVQDVHWVSLQKDDEASDLRIEKMTSTLLALGGLLRDFSDTAAVMAHLDLIITPDTAVAHLAGALGRPVWLMLPHVAEWRWLMTRDDSPWYPTMRLYRQHIRGDWTEAVGRMTVDLQDVIGAKS
ncbi:MAG: hypothetical protein CMF67_13880 [Magnetovibrio sp.]|nr:hypothetical protein [Magnetovibrio sp.]